MEFADLKTLRKQQGWKQQDLARHLGVSQALVSHWEQGMRSVPVELMRKLAKLGLEVDATKLAFRNPSEAVAASKKMDFAQELSNLGYPPYQYFRSGPAAWNPAQFLVLALSQPDLDARVAEGLSWVGRHFAHMDWDWVRREAKLRDLQNRVGFTLALARKVAEARGESTVATHLAQQETLLRGSLLAREDTYSRDRMTSREREWVRTHRSQEAQDWHVLTDLVMEHLPHVHR
jgi:transcriptional regulator with XRE-family HTH domain